MKKTKYHVLLLYLFNSQMSSIYMYVSDETYSQLIKNQIV